MSREPLESLRTAGLDRLPSAMRKVFTDLNAEELAIVGSIQERLNAAAPDIEGQGDIFNTVC